MLFEGADGEDGHAGLPLRDVAARVRRKQVHLSPYSFSGCQASVWPASMLRSQPFGQRRRERLAAHVRA